MSNKFLIFVLGIFLVGSVFAGSLVNVTPEHFEIPNLYAGESFETSFSFEYPEDLENYNNAPLIVKVDIASNSVGYPVWKDDFEMKMVMKQYYLPGNFFYRTIPLTCTEESPLEFNSLEGIDLRYIEDIPNGTFYCYNENLYILNLNSRNDVTLEVQTNIALYPDLYNFTIEFYKIDEHSIPIVEGWNLISFPTKINENVEEFFGKSEKLESIWSYENGHWYYYAPSDVNSDLEKIVPGRGYWIKSKEDSFILVGENLMEPQVVLPSIHINEGWNLIGHYGLESKTAYCNLFSLVNDSYSTKWEELFGFDSWSKEFEKLNRTSIMNPGEGYWLGSGSEGDYFPSTVCI